MHLYSLRYAIQMDPHHDNNRRTLFDGFWVGGGQLQDDPREAKPFLGSQLKVPKIPYAMKNLQNATQSSPKTTKLSSIPETKNLETQISSKNKEKPPHFATNPIKKNFGSIRLGLPGYEYIIAENTQNESFYVYPLSSMPLDIQRENIQRINSPYFVNIYYTFSDIIDDIQYNFAAQEVMSLSLAHLRQADLDDIQLASILNPVLKGLDYLHSEGLEHRNICCSTVQLNYHGEVKICAPESCEQLSCDRDTKGFQNLLYELIEGKSLENKTEGFILNHSVSLNLRGVMSDAALNFIESVIQNNTKIEDILLCKFLKTTKSSPEALKGLLAKLNWSIGIVGNSKCSWKEIIYSRQMINEKQSLILN